MLKGLDEIEWEKLSHAYGSARDVPGLLRALLSDEAANRESALAELYGSIWHQGTIYEATIFAVPFLIELLAHPATADKAGIACLLASIADGGGYLEAHVRSEADKETWRGVLAKQRKELESELKREAEIARRVREAAREALPLLAPYLSHSEADVRSLIPRALASFPEDAETYLPMLEAALAMEADGYVR